MCNKCIFYLFILRFCLFSFAVDIDSIVIFFCFVSFARCWIVIVNIRNAFYERKKKIDDGYKEKYMCINRKMDLSFWFTFNKQLRMHTVCIHFNINIRSLLKIKVNSVCQRIYCFCFSPFSILWFMHSICWNTLRSYTNCFLLMMQTIFYRDDVIEY